MKIKYIVYAFIPVLVLLAATIIASVLGYLVFIAIEGKLELHKIISKTALILLILSIFPAMRWLNLNKRDLGFAEKSEFLKQLSQGLVLGFLTLMPVLLALYFLDINIVDQSKEGSIFYIMKSLLVALFLSLLISFAEEPLFRGVLLTGYVNKLGAITGIVISSIYYAALHFLKPNMKISYDQATFYSGFELVGAAFRNAVSVENLPAFSALFMVGCFLAIIRNKYKLGLGICIGCHAGWVVQIKMTRKFFNTDPNSELAWLTSSYDGVIGPLVTTWLLLVIIVFLTYSWYVNRQVRS